MNNEIKKGMVFVGCSFTWGQGLYYYSKMSTLKQPPPEQFSYDLLTAAHTKFMESTRFARIVASHYGTFEVCRNQNGGSEQQTIDFLRNIFDKSSDAPNPSHRHKYDFDEIGHIIVQTSVPVRNPFEVVINGELVRLEWYMNSKEKQKLLFKWMEENNVHGQPEFYNLLLKQWYDKLKSDFEFYESKGIKCKILCWHDDYLMLIRNDPWMYERFIELEYNDEKYACIDYLCRTNDNMLIKDDIKNLGPNPPRDSHPSLECHKIIAESIIKKLDSEK